jgi:hypothetical protein
MTYIYYREKLMRLLLVLLFALSSITVSFAQQCARPADSSLTVLTNLAQSSLSSACIIQREKFKCSELESELVGDEKQRIIQCDARSLDANKLSQVSFSDCVLSGIKLSGENLLDLVNLPGKIAEGIVKGFHDTQLCNASSEKKRELLNAYNLTIKDSRFQLDAKFLGKWLDDATCGEIDKLLFARYQNYQNTLMKERISNINAGKKVAEIEAEKKDDTGLMSLLKSAMEGAEVRYQCYTPKVKAEMICAGITSLIVDTAMGMGVKSAITKITAIVKSKKALSTISRAVAAGEKIDLSDTSKLLVAERKKAAALVLEKDLTEVQEKAIIEAHEVGLKEGRGYFDYTTDDLRKKAMILKKAGFTEDERALLLRSGITGQFSAEEAKNAVINSIQKQVSKGTLKEREARIKLFTKYLDEYKKTEDPAIKANYARLLGEMAKAEDAKASKGFFQMGLDKIKEVAEKDKGYFLRTKTLDNYIELASKAGDQAAVKKGMSEYVKQQFVSEGKRNGWKSTADTAEGLFNRLEEDVQHYRALGPKGATNLEAARRQQKALLEEFKFIDQTGRKMKTVDADYTQFN